MTDEQIATLNTAIREWEAFAARMMAALQPVIDAMVEFARQIVAWLQRAAAEVARYLQAAWYWMEPYHTLYRREQLYRNLLYLWVPVVVAQWIAARWPKRYLPALRV